MTSINTNVSAMAALSTLRSINSDMDTTQQRISTGFKVDGASDNAAYWSIATTMRSDNKALATVSEALGLGKASVDIAYEAMDSAVDIVQEIQTKLVGAKAENVDKAKIQGEISELQGQLESIVNSASFNSENFLSADMADTAALIKNVVGSFNRDADGNVTIENLRIDTTSFVMMDANASAAVVEDADFETTTVTMADAGATAGTLAFNGVTIDVEADATAAEIAAAFADNDFTDYVARADGDDVVFVAKSTGDKTDLAAGDFSVTGGTVVPGTVTVDNDGVEDEFPAGILNTKFAVGFADDDSVLITDLLTFDITNMDGAGAEASKTQLDALIGVVDNLQKEMVDGASTLGSLQNRIEIQTDFLANLMDSIDSGIGTLVDADMTEESTRLKALQTQQQLGIQSLSIANANSQNILQLFQN